MLPKIRARIEPHDMSAIGGSPLPLGVFAILGLGNVICLSEALEAVKGELPTWRGQNEQSIALAVIGFATAARARSSSLRRPSGPGPLNQPIVSTLTPCLVLNDWMAASASTSAL
jgi:TPP-dependent trihydroxycyclohexane-1,2-dione (THcHDO) dehydratase